MPSPLYSYEGPKQGTAKQPRRVQCPFCLAPQEIPPNVLTASCLSCEKGIYMGDYVYNKKYTLEGTLVTRGNVIVGPQGHLKAQVSATRVVVGGLLEGDVEAVDSVELAPTGKLYGNVTTRSLTVMEGGVFVGECRISRTPSITPLV